MISIPTRLDTSFPLPPRTMPNTPCKYSPCRNVRVPASIPNPDSANELLNNRLQSELDLGEIGPVNDTPKIAQSSIIRRRKEKGDLEAHVVGVREHRQGTRWVLMLVPFLVSMTLGSVTRRRFLNKLKRRGIHNIASGVLTNCIYARYAMALFRSPFCLYDTAR